MEFLSRVTKVWSQAPICLREVTLTSPASRLDPLSEIHTPGKCSWSRNLATSCHTLKRGVNDTICRAFESPAVASHPLRVPNATKSSSASPGSEAQYGVSQIELFATEPELPEGFAYKPELISREEEQTLVRAI